MMDLAPEPGTDAKLPRLARHCESVEFRGVTLPIRARRGGPRRNYTQDRARPANRVVGTQRIGQNDAPGPVAAAVRTGQPSNSEHGRLQSTGWTSDCVRPLAAPAQIGVVTQDNRALPRTIRGNIAYGAEDATQERIEPRPGWPGARFIGAMPQVYDTAVATRG